MVGAYINAKIAFIGVLISGGVINFIESGRNFDRKFICDIIYK